ncbi:Serine/threonine-protein kinase ATM [Sesamum alatum]|uniref:Serine/threonine-protein kinase ATM n=1 Tax=Sesamum alatum TaxID=300844 RepID=A0AAE1YVC3_9LAMI|nr:Serine/threonine-protein kinase ATM [Sesamum alatum]
MDDLGELVVGESDSNQEYLHKENGSVSPGVTNASVKNEGEDIVEEQECTFDVGDLVWVKTRTPLWWPGMISDPSNADGIKSEKRGSFLVKYFGNANFIWCKNSDLKPFAEYFEQMSRQNNSRSFCGSVEKALSEVGLRVKSKMTCPCFSKESQTLAVQQSVGNREEGSTSMGARGKSDVQSLSLFDPASITACIRHLARSVHVPGKVELTVMKNHLSAFYRSVGHQQLPLHLLRSSSDASQRAQDGLTSELTDKGHNKLSGSCRKTVPKRQKRKRSDGADLVLDDKKASSGKGSESRERKKSRYLSYPYVDVNQGLKDASTVGQETEDLKQSSGPSTNSTPLGSCSGTNSRKRGSRKPSRGNHTVSKEDNIDACSAELLAELCSAARDSSYLSRSKYSGSLKRFYSSFRTFAFLNVDTVCKDAGSQQAPDLERCPPHNSTETEGQMEGIRGVKEPENQRTNIASIKESAEDAVGNKISQTENLQAKGNVDICRSTKKKKEKVISGGVESVSTKKKKKQVISGGLESVSTKKKKEQVISGGPESVSNCFGMGTNINPNSSWVISFQQTCPQVPECTTTATNTEGATPGLPQVNMIARLPDLNGNHPSFSIQQIPCVGPFTNFGNSLPEQTREGFVSPNVNGVNQMVFASVPSLKDATFQNIPQVGNVVNNTTQYWNGEFRSRELESGLMNTGFISFVQPSLQMGLFPSAGKPESKKRKRKEKACEVPSVIPDLNRIDSSSPGKTLLDGNHVPPEGLPDTSSPGKTLPDGNHMMPEGKPQQKRRNKAADVEPGSNVKTTRNSNNVEELGGSLLLNFAPGSTLPSKEMLVATFSRFGLLKESEIQVQDDSTVQIVYERSSDARFASRSLEKSKPFGEALASFKLHCTPEAPKTTGKRNRLQMPQPFLPVNTCKNPAKPGAAETPDIACIRQNVEMMKSTLEKAGNSLSSEMRAKLENAIKAFLEKLSSMGGSSSS